MCDQCEEAEVTFSVRLASLQGTLACLDLALRSINEAHQKLVIMQIYSYELVLPSEVMKPLKEVRAFIIAEITSITYNHKVIHLSKNENSQPKAVDTTGSRAAVV